MKIKKLKEWEKHYSQENPTKLSWPWMSNLIKTFFIQKEKKHKITMAHECQIWYLVTMLYI